MYSILSVLVGALVLLCFRWGRITATTRHEQAIQEFRAQRATEFARAVESVRCGQSRSIALYDEIDTDSKMTQLVGLTELEELILEHCDLTTAGTRTISRIPNLKRFCYSYYSELGDDGLRCLSMSRSLEAIVIVESRVSAGGMDWLRSLRPLRTLVFYQGSLPGDSPRSADSMIETLSGFQHLRFLAIGGSWLAEKHLDELMRKLPHAEIVLLREEPASYSLDLQELRRLSRTIESRGNGGRLGSEPTRSRSEVRASPACFT
jgi:hypothetical protein